MIRPTRRPLGRSGLHVAPFALGGNVFGWTADRAVSFRVLDAFVDAGFNLVDTADVYSIWVPGHQGGESETILGEWMRSTGRRDEVVIATKVGMDMKAGGSGLAPDHIARSVKGSLARLGTDRIDLYQAHEDDPTVPLETTLRAFSTLRDAGTVHAIGASNYSPERLAEAIETSERLGLARFESFQPRYNLLDRADFELGPEPVCRRFGLGVITYSSLASGFLSGKYRTEADLSKSPRGARAARGLSTRGHRILAALDTVAERTGTAPATVALAWLIARPSVTAPIASATSPAQLSELLRAAELHLDATALRELDTASAEDAPA